MYQRLSSDPKESNLLGIKNKEKFKCEVGLSDHTQGIGAVASITLGATIIEKHIVLKE